MPFTLRRIQKVPDNKPVVYRILTRCGRTNYVGVAQRGRVRERLQEHLGKIPGASVRIQQMASIAEAGETEARIIARSQPKYNRRG